LQASPQTRAAGAHLLRQFFVFICYEAHPGLQLLLLTAKLLQSAERLLKARIGLINQYQQGNNKASQQ
jgi:hypothetical protein